MQRVCWRPISTKTEKMERRHRRISETRKIASQIASYLASSNSGRREIYN